MITRPRADNLHAPLEKVLLDPGVLLAARGVSFSTNRDSSISCEIMKHGSVFESHFLLLCTG